MANCKICGSDAGLGHCICLHCLADWSRMRLVVAEYVKKVFDDHEFNSFKVPVNDEFKRLSSKFKKDPLFVRSLIEWGQPWPNWESNRVFNLILRKVGGLGEDTKKEVNETMDFLREMWHSDQVTYKENVDSMQNIYGNE